MVSPPEQKSCGSTSPLEHGTLRFFPPFLGSALWVLVDVGHGGVVASTAPQILEINHQTEETNLESQVAQRGIPYFLEQRYVGGPYAEVSRSRGLLFVQHCTPEQLNQMVVLAEVSVQSGTLQATVNQYRQELAPLLPLSLEPTQGVIFLPISCSGTGVPDRTYGAELGAEFGAGFKVNVSSTVQSSNTLEQVLWTRPGSSPETLVLQMQLQEPLNEFSDRGLLVQWIPEQNKAQVRQEIAEPGFSGFHNIVSVSHSAALVSSFFLSNQSGRLRFKSSGALVPLQGDSAASIFPDRSVSN
jgi:hypothetical protein